jgi:enamine deaminase RidA (YjgF/YER057c/UK114 family)
MWRMSSRVGDLVLVIGMIGQDEGGRIVDGVTAQTSVALKRVEAVLAEHGTDRTGIVRLRAFVTDIREWPAAREVIREFFDGDAPPATAMAVTGLVEPAVKVELEVDAAAGVSAT